MSRNLAVFGLSDDLDAPVGCEHLLQAQAQLGVVFSQHYSHGPPLPRRPFRQCAACHRLSHTTARATWPQSCKYGSREGVEEQGLVVSERYNPAEAIACNQAGIRGGLPRGKKEAVDAG